jgi:hypothetical protein
MILETSIGKSVGTVRARQMCTRHYQRSPLSFGCHANAL